jgi:hypothetical protein
MISVASEKKISTAKKRDIAPFKVNGQSECFREIWDGLETRDLTSSSTRQLLQNNMGLTIYLEGGYVTFFRRRNFFFRRHRNHIFLFSGEVPI